MREFYNKNREQPQYVKLVVPVNDDTLRFPLQAVKMAQIKVAPLIAGKLSQFIVLDAGEPDEEITAFGNHRTLNIPNKGH